MDEHAVPESAQLAADGDKTERPAMVSPENAQADESTAREIVDAALKILAGMRGIQL